MADADLIKRYLLGDLLGDQRIRFEDEYFSDTECFGRLEAAENDLIDSYVRGRLSESERQQFKRQYLSSENRRRRGAFAQTLYQFTLQNEEPLLKERAFRWWSPWAIFDGPYRWPRMALATAAISVVVVCASWLVTENRKLRIELNQAETARAELQRSHDALTQQIANLNMPAPAAAPKAGRVAEVAKVEPPPLPGVSLTLTPGMVRAGGREVPTVHLPWHRTSVRLHLVLAQYGHEHGTYDAAVRTTEGQEPIFTLKDLKPTKGGGGTIVVLHVPSRLIQPADYTVTLYNSGTELSGEGVGSYVFRAR